MFRLSRLAAVLSALASFCLSAAGCAVDDEPADDADASVESTFDSSWSEVDMTDAVAAGTDDAGTAGSDSADGSAPTTNPDVDTQPRSWPERRPGCNGHPDLCERPFDEVVFPATHNSMSNEQDGWVLPNQNTNMRAQLIDGIRAFLIDVYEQRGQLVLCHSVCTLGQRDYLEALQELRSFLDENPGEVISLLIQNAVSSQQLDDALVESGLAPYAIVQDPNAPWPTLQELVDRNTRLLVTVESGGPPPERIHSLWAVAWDTPYSFESVEAFNCTQNRGDSTNALFLINHWLSAPAALPEFGPVANAGDVLRARVEECRTDWGRLPTFIAVDYHDAGDLMTVVDELNGVAR